MVLQKKKQMAKSKQVCLGGQLARIFEPIFNIETLRKGKRIEDVENQGNPERILERALDIAVSVSNKRRGGGEPGGIHLQYSHHRRRDKRCCGRHTSFSTKL
jgi:hypothetical protein